MQNAEFQKFGIFYLTKMQFYAILESWKGNTANPKNRENGK